MANFEMWKDLMKKLKLSSAPYDKKGQFIDKIREIDREIGGPLEDQFWEDLKQQRVSRSPLTKKLRKESAHEEEE